MPDLNWELWRVRTSLWTAQELRDAAAAEAAARASIGAMMFTANQLVSHAIGDYLFQSHWAAQEKTKAQLPAAVHAATYTLAFLPLARSPWRLAAIAGTHFLIDRYRLARYVVWAKNQMAPAAYRPRDVTATGYPADTPPWLAVWLLILADNLIHVLVNAAILRVGRKR